MRRVLWAVALLAMAGSVFSLLLLWAVVSLTSTSKTQAKIGGKDKQAALSDGDVSSEDGASDVATGTLNCRNLRQGRAATDVLRAPRSGGAICITLLP